MSNYAPPPHNPDGRIFASYPMPAKIDLLKEAPRRESLVDQQLGRQIEISLGPPRIEISQESGFDAQSGHWPQANHNEQGAFNRQVQLQHLPQNPGQLNQVTPSRIETMNATTKPQQSAIGSKNLNNAAILAAELAAKEAKLMAEITAFHQRPYSPFQVPNKIDLTSEQREVQRQYQNAPSPRPGSRVSSRCTSTDLLDKEAKLLQEIEEIGKKPFNPQTMVVEREQWYEYPEGRPNDRHLTESKRRIKDFCSIPQEMYPGEGLHIHEDNLPVSSLGRPSSAIGSMHTTIIRSPKREIDNKSPLPFAFDNFTTKGVRGNIASVGAIEPERPRPPIYPIIKRTPSPSIH